MDGVFSSNERIAVRIGSLFSPRHAMLAVGYIEDRQVFIVRNSWGPDWVGIN